MKKNKISFLFVLVLVVANTVFSQDIIFDWKHIIGNGQDNQGKTITVDSAGYVYVGGLIKGTLTFLDTTVNATGTYEGFVAKLTPAGNMVWFKWFRSGYCYVESICIDRENHLYVTGIYQNSISFDTTIHSNNTDSASISNMFIAKFDTAGTLLWAKNTTGVWYLAGDGTGPLKKLTVDNQNNLIVTGRCIDKLQYFDTTATITTLDSTWVTNPFPHWEYYQAETGFLAKYTSAGQKLWVKKIGGLNCDPYAVKTDNENNIIVTGSFQSVVTFDTISFQPNYTNVKNIFLAKFNSNGALMWAQRSGGSYGYDVGVDSDDNIYFTGDIGGNQIEFGGTIYFIGSYIDAFIAKYDSAGNVKWVLPIGTSHITGNYTNNKGLSLKVFNNNIYFLGSFMDTLTYGNITLQSDGKYETFLMKLDLSGNVLEVGQYLAHMFTYPQELAIDNSNNIYITGFQSNKIFIGRVHGLLSVIISEVKVNNNNFEIYPNPTTGKFYIKALFNDKTDYKITIFDISSKIIAENVNGESIRFFDFSDLEKGLYFIRISNEKNVNTYKIITQ